MFKNLEAKEIDFILENNYIGHLGYIYNSKPFVVPITYYFDKETNGIICYSGGGHKMNAMRKNNTISLQINEIETSNNWKSILVHGTFKQFFGSEAKSYLHKFSLGVKHIIMEKEYRKVDFIKEFSSKIYKDDIPSVFIISIDEITGKMRKT